MRLPTEPIRMHLEAQRAAVVSDLARDLVDADPPGDSSDADRLDRAGAWFDLFVDVLGSSPAQVAERWVSEHLDVAGAPVSKLAPVLSGIAMTRRCMTGYAQSALQGQVEGSWDALLRWGELCDEIARRAIAVTEQRLDALQDALHRAHAQDDISYHRTPVMMHSLNGEGKLLRVNDTWLETLGYRREEVLGRSILDFMSDEARAGVGATLPDAFRMERQRRLPIQLMSKTGELVDVELDATYEKDENGHVLRTFSVMVNVTERNRIERALRESETRYRNLVELAPEGILVHRWGKITYMNPAGLRILGASAPGEIVGKGAFDILHPDYHEVVRARIRTVSEARLATPTLEQKFIRVDGSAVDVEVSGVPIQYEGEPATQVAFRDITDRKQAEEALRKSARQEEQLRVQEMHLRALSTPLIPLTENVVLMPLIGDIDSRRASQILETLLQGVVTHSAVMAILDVTGMTTVDSQMAESLRRTTQAVKLLGAEVILTGIAPSMAQALVELGADLSGIVTHGTLRAGIAYALSKAKPRR